MFAVVNHDGQHAAAGIRFRVGLLIAKADQSVRVQLLHLADDLLLKLQYFPGGPQIGGTDDRPRRKPVVAEPFVSAR